MDIRLCDGCNFDKSLEIVKRYEIGLEFQTFRDPTLEDLRIHVEYQKEKTQNIKNKSLHAPFWDLNLGSATPGIQQETMKWFNYAYYIAKELDCDSLIVHNGYVPCTSNASNWVKIALNFWKEFFSDKDDSITIMLENQLELDSGIIIQEVDEFQDKRLKACLDIGHAHCNSDMSVYDWVKTLNNRIGYVHLHNNHGKYNKNALNWDEHLGLLNGTIDIKEVLRLIKENCPQAILAIETRADDSEKSVKYIKETL